MSKQEDKQRDLWDVIGTDKSAAKQRTSLFEQVQLVHRALPETSFELIDLTTEFCGKMLAAPLWLSAPSYAPRDPQFELTLAGLAEKHGLALCTASLAGLLQQGDRPASLELRQVAPTALLMAGIGAEELASMGPPHVAEAARALGADGVTVFLQGAWRIASGEAKLDLRGAVAAIAALSAADPDLPIVVKESGSGLSYLDGAFLQAVGVRRVEVGGAGGTSPFAVAKRSEDERLSRLGEMLVDWGVPAAVSTDWLSTQGFEVIASGGVQTALDGAAALALGGALVGLVDPLVKHHRKGGTPRLDSYLSEFIDGLRTVLLLCGVRKPKDMPGVPRIVGPELGRWFAAGPSAL